MPKENNPKTKRQDTNPHSDHRQRVFKKYDDSGFSHMYKHEMLEMILFYAIGRKDTNEIAHDLLKECNNKLLNVLKAPRKKLEKVDGVGEGAARFLNALGELFEYVKTEDPPKKLNSDTVCDIMSDTFKDTKREELHMFCLDPKDNIIKSECMNVGSFESSEVDLGKIMRFAVECDCAQVVLAHNHPSGIACASQADMTVTTLIEHTLNIVGIKVWDHIIYANGKCISIKNEMAKNKKQGYRK